jgi:hypothetical protein
MDFRLAVSMESRVESFDDIECLGESAINSPVDSG